MAFFRSGGIRIARVGLAVVTVGSAIGALAVYVLLIRDLPDFQNLDDYRPPVISEVYDRYGRLIGEFFIQKRRIVPIEQIPRHVQFAFVAAEDGAFFEHKGIDYSSILRAAIANLREGGIAQGASTITQQMVKSLLLTPARTYKRKMREIILARRIEQQFSKEEILFLYLNQIYFGNSAWGIGQAARSYFGKEAPDLTISEAALLAGLPQRPSAYNPNRNPEAAETRRRYVLRRMLEDGYIDEEIFELELDSPPELKRHPDLENIEVSRYFVEEVRRLLFERLDGDIVNNNGLRIETTLDVDLQRAARNAVQRGLEAHDHRRGYRGAIRSVVPDQREAELERLDELNSDEFVVLLAEDEDPPLESQTDEELSAETPAIREIPFDTPLKGIVLAVDPEAGNARIGFARDVEGEAWLTDVEWAREPDPLARPRPVKAIGSIFEVGDVATFIRLPDESDPKEEQTDDETPRLARLDIWQTPLAEGALLSLENDTGDVLAMIGGYDFDRSEFNRAVQAERQPGSAFKPLIYGAALTRGYTPVSTVIDRPVVYRDPVTGFVWAPRNYGRKFHGPMTMRDALKKSINNATVHLFRDVGVRYVIDYARRFGIQSTLSADLSLALGSSSVTLLELTRAYAIYPRGGTRLVPRFIAKVTDRDGNGLLSDVPLGDVPQPVLKPLLAPGEVREESYPDSEIMPTTQLISPADAYLMS
ncbi:MAG: transglycosylase domain-containing protein, partial [Myxococcota bacterium]